MAMSNVRHAAKLREGARAWNLWRAQNPGLAPDLSDLKLPVGATRFGPGEGGPIDLSRANLRRAALAGADLSGACLDEADLSGADLSGATLGQADLTGAQLVGADLSGTWLGDARGLTQAQIDRARGHGATVLPSHLVTPPAWLGEEPVSPQPKAAEPGVDKPEEEADSRADRGSASKRAGNGAGKDSGASGDPYSILGVSRKASQSEIRAAYLRLAKELHPDGRIPGDDADDAVERLKLINDAYQTLKGAERQLTIRNGERRHRASAVFVAGVMTAMVPLAAIGLYAAWSRAAPGPATTVAVPDRTGGAALAARNGAPGNAGADGEAVETGAISVHVKETDSGRGRALATARKQGTREAWEQLMAAFPDEEAAAEARTAIAAFEQAEARRREAALAWAKVENGDDREALQRFVLAYPESANADRARETIAAIELTETRRRQEAADWARIERSDDKQELQQFVLKHPEGTYTGRARDRIAAIELAEARRREEQTAWAKVERSGSKQELQQFVLTYPSSTQAGRARQRIAAIDLTEVRRRETIAWAEAQKGGEKGRLERFARTRPHSVYAVEARRRVALLQAEERRRDDAAWDKAVRVHSRAAYAAYLTRHPNGQHAADANQRMADLARADTRPTVEPVRATPGIVADAPATRPRAPDASQGWSSADEPFIGADGRIRR